VYSRLFENHHNQRLGFGRRLLAAVLISSLVSLRFWGHPVEAQTMAYCQLPEAAKQEKETLLQASVKGDKDAQNRYTALLTQQAEELRQCRSRTWPQTQAIWLAMYPCDIYPGVVDKILDHIVNQGYNQVNVDVFSDGRVLLPASDNPTVWPSLVQELGGENTDLLAQVIQKGHERGLKVYAWIFLMNFGYSYSLHPERQSVLARNGKGETSLDLADIGSQVFVDPYNPQAQTDYYQMLQEVIRRHPDGVLFDYVRYPRQVGKASIATKVKDLWIYSDAAKEALYQRALNPKGLEVIRRFLSQGYVTVADVAAVDKIFPEEREPLWQGRSLPLLPPETKPNPPAAQRQQLWESQLWHMSVAHAMQGILDFMEAATLPVQQQGIPAGAVFFTDSDDAVGQGYDARLQPWDMFEGSLEWNPMAYGNCGDTSCIVAQVQRVLQYAPPGTQVSPVLAGVWGQSLNHRPSLEAQMQAIHQAAPQIDAVSSFSFSWQEPQFDSDRKFCHI
jgi:hypothetical protein